MKTDLIILQKLVLNLFKIKCKKVFVKYRNFGYKKSVDVGKYRIIDNSILFLNML